jgi:hypothetical protein
MVHACQAKAHSRALSWLCIQLATVRHLEDPRHLRRDEVRRDPQRAPQHAGHGDGAPSLSGLGRPDRPAGSTLLRDNVIVPPLPFASSRLSFESHTRPSLRVAQEYGVTWLDKRSIGSKICHNLLNKIRFDLTAVRERDVGVS